ncbi:GPN-loop GTPase, partial [Pancytospora epiphaga]
RAMGYAVFVFGAAGAGKTTFCRNIKEHAQSSRTIRLVNLDPASYESQDYDVNLCDHITVADVMENCDYGPNGGLFAALEEAIANIDELKLHELEGEYVIFDCPGQIELFLHSSTMQDCISHVSRFFRVAIVYLTDATNFTVPSKYLYGSLCATLSVARFVLPVINILSKVDLVDAEELERILTGEGIRDPEDAPDNLTKTVIEYVNSNGMFDYMPLDWNDDETIENILLQLDIVLQRIDDLEPTEKDK